MSDSIISNKILLAQMNDFASKYAMSSKTESKLFEYFVNNVVLSRIDPDSFSDPAVFDAIDVDRGGSFGIDSFSLFINDTLSLSKEDIDRHKKNKQLDVRFVFIQSKSSSSLNSGDILKFIAAVDNILSSPPALPLSNEMEDARDLINEMYKAEHARRFRTKPQLELHYATSGTPLNDPLITALLRNEAKKLQQNFTDVIVSPIVHVDAEYLIDSYKEIDNRFSVTINFEKSVPCDRIGDVEQAFIGYLAAPEFLKLVASPDGSLRRNVFYENVRDFQGTDNAVNSEIGDTLSRKDMLDKFILLNNGVTVVARQFKNIRLTEYEVSDYYIVNGCQTSHMIFKHRESAGASSTLKVPVKFIHTHDNDLMADLIRSTNRQTPVPDEAFVSLEKFHKRLQDAYPIYAESSGETLYYERRSREYSGFQSDIEKLRIINLHSLIRSFASVVLSLPQSVRSNNPSHILKEHHDRMFRDEHRLAPYYLSSLMVYKVHRLCVNGTIDERFIGSRYWLAWIARMIETKGSDLPPLNSSRTENACDAIIQSLRSPDHTERVFKDAVRVFESAKAKHSSKYGETRYSQLLRQREFRDEIKTELRSSAH